jgi:hypothetical protein
MAKIKNLHLLSDDDLIELYKSSKSVKKTILIELNKRGITLVGKKFSKRILKTGRNIEMFLKECGFTYYASKINGNNRYASGCCEFIKEKIGDELYCFQINGLGLTEIKSVSEPVIFSINGKDPSITPQAFYVKEYSSFQEMVSGESDKLNFIALNNWSFN